MHKAVKSSTLYHFADDTNLSYSASSLKRLKTALNKDLALLYDWFCANRLSLNAENTQVIIFRPPRKQHNLRITLRLHNTTLNESTRIKYLGIILDNKLNCKPLTNSLKNQVVLYGCYSK